MLRNSLVAISMGTLLSGCLTGSDGSTATTTTPAPTTFPVASARATLIANGWSKTFVASITGTLTCSGTGAVTVSPASTSTTFAMTPTNSVSALSATQSVTENWTNCTPATQALSSTNYYNPSSYIDLGDSLTGVNYNVFQTAPSYPATVKVGDTGIIGTENLYTNSTETASNGQQQVSYTVAADTTTTAIVTIIYNITGSSNNGSEQDKWRISTSGTLTPISVVFSYTSGAYTGQTQTWTYN